MASAIDATKPVAGSPTTQSVRDNFATAASEITALQAAATSLAPLASPTFTGDPKAPTPATADSDTSIATTAYVQAQGYATAVSMTAADNLRVLKAGDAISGGLTVAGNVGIGTTTPTEKLTVVGGIKVKGGVMAVNEANAGGIDSATGLTRIFSWGPNNTTMGAVQFLQQSANGSVSNTPIFITPAGNVGIQTSGPQFGLDVAGSARSYNLTVGDLTAFDGFIGLYARSATAYAPGIDMSVTNAYAGFQISRDTSITNFWAVKTIDAGQNIGIFTDNNASHGIFVATGGKVGIGTTAPGSLLTVNGVCANVSGAWTTISDATVKQDVQPYTRGLDAIVALKPVEFRYVKGTPFAEANKPSRQLFGLIADEVKPHVPEVVGTTTATIGKKDGVELSTLEPGNLIYALINAVKELNDQGKEMRAKIAALESATVH